MTPYSNKTKLPAEDLTKVQSKPTKAAALRKILWIHFIFLTYYHIAGFYGLYLSFKTAKWATIGLAVLLYLVSIVWTTAGAHRLWAHKSYKAKLPLQIILMIFQSVSFQKSVINWVKDHRLHHKFSDTDVDPHNANRGFFFSHMGWLILKRSDEVTNAHKLTDMRDICNNPVLTFQKKYSVPVIFTLCFFLPTVMPMYFWGETLTNAWHVNMLRYIAALNVVCCINSVAHKFGNKPYDKNILPVQNNILSFVCLGEGFHNYHHAFPWDYRASELGNRRLNYSTWFIDFFAWVGWAYDLKKANEDIVKSRAERTGDGTDLWGATKFDKNL